MERLPKHILESFMKGEHVMRHQDGYWNWLWSDMFIDTTFMKFVKGSGDLVGVIMLELKTMKIWASSLHTCCNLLNDVDNVKTTQSKVQQKQRNLPFKVRSS